MPRLFIQTMFYVFIFYGEHLLQNLAVGTSGGHGCLCDQLPVKTLSSESQTAFPGHTHYTGVDIFLLPERERAVCDPSQEAKGIGSQHRDFSRLCLVCFFRYVFPNIAVYPDCTAVINVNHKYEAEIHES